MDAIFPKEAFLRDFVSAVKDCISRTTSFNEVLEFLLCFLSFLLEERDDETLDPFPRIAAGGCVWRSKPAALVWGYLTLGPCLGAA